VLNCGYLVYWDGDDWLVLSSDKIAARPDLAGPVWDDVWYNYVERDPECDGRSSCAIILMPPSRPAYLDIQVKNQCSDALLRIQLYTE
jgi:hypothetical protein